MTLSKSGTTVTVDALNGTLKYWAQPIRETIGIAADGTVKGSATPTFEEYIEITVKANRTKMTELRNFYLNTARGKSRTFTLTPDSGVDFGAGDGNPVTVRFWMDSFEEPQKFYQTFLATLRFRREIT